MRLSNVWLNELFGLSYSDAWTKIQNRVSNTVTTLDASSTKEYYPKLEKEIDSIESILSQSAWDLWQNFDECPKASDAVVSFWQETIGPKAVLVLDALSIREAGILMNRMSSFGLVIADFSTAASEIPSETNLYAKALGLRGRSLLETQSAPASFRLAMDDCYIDSFKQLPFEDCLARLPPTKNNFIWHSWPDDSVHGSDKVEDAMNHFINHVESVFESNGFKKFLKTLARGRSLLITSDHGYCNTGSFQIVAGNAKDELKSIGHARAKELKKIPKDSKSAKRTIPPVTLDIEASSTTDIYRVAIGKRRPPDKGFPSLTHGGLSLMECCVPLIQIREA